MDISAKKRIMGRPIAKGLIPIKSPQNVDVGFGLFQLRPDGSRDIRAEYRQFGKIMMIINGMSGQLAS